MDNAKSSWVIITFGLCLVIVAVCGTSNGMLCLSLLQFSAPELAARVMRGLIKKTKGYGRQFNGQKSLVYKGDKLFAGISRGGPLLISLFTPIRAS